MKVELIPSTVGETGPLQYCTTFVINETIAIDAGTLGLLHPLERQQAVRHLFLSHCHIDHLATLPLFLDNVFTPEANGVRVYANQTTRECLQNDVFNDRLWPDFIKLSQGDAKFLVLEDLRSEVAVVLDDLVVTPIALNHNVPTFGFLVESDEVAAAIVSDTSPTERIWEVLQAVDNLSAVFMECSFPDSHRWLADEAFHLCPELFATELDKLGRDVDVFVCHVKPAFYTEVAAELQALGIPRVQLADPGRLYDIVR